MSTTRETVGIIGIGRMGMAMAKHVLKHGYELSVCDINPDSVKQAVGLGAKALAHPKDLAQSCSFIMLGVGYDEEVAEVVLGEQGLIHSLNPGSIVAVSSTVAPDFVRDLDQKLRAKGSDLLDAPICRGRWFADEGKLLALFGGRPEIIERGRRIYSTFCSDIAPLGDVGHGQVGKAMNNLMLWITSIGLIEAGRIAESTGIDLVKLRDALMISSGKSQALEDWDQTSFTWALKDMQIVMKMADKANLSLPISGAVKELVKEARQIKAKNAPKWTGQ